MKSILTMISVITALAASAANPVAEVKKAVAPDSRQVVFEVSLDTLPSGELVLRGVTSEQSAKDAMTARLRADGLTFADSLRVYPSDSRGLVMIPAASLRTRPAHSAEMATQAVMGTPVRILEHSGEMYRIQTPDGYIAYVPDSSIKAMTADEMDAWREAADRRVVTAYWQTRAYTTPEATGPRDVVTDLVAGAIVRTDPADIRNGRIRVTTPDGRQGWADASALTPINEWADQEFDAQKILDMAYSMEGTPYLWGGTSTKAIDCSGLVKVSYLDNGLILMRDASQQALTGQKLDPARWQDFQAADLMFFGNAETGRITHVALYDNSGRYVHSSGRVKRNSVDPASPDWLYSPIAAVRIHGSEGTPGIVRAKDHPWYFNLK